MQYSFLLSLALSSVHSVLAATVTYDWCIEWVTANPDGRQARPVVGINGAWPNPAIEANVGDTVVVKMYNNLGNETTSLHFHGLYQAGSNQYDGPPGVVACPILPGQSFTYEFEINQPGTYWYHSHSPGQYADGLRGPLIVHDKHNPYASQIDGEIVITLSDWYHDQMPTLLAYYLSPSQNPSGAEPIPYSGLMGETQLPHYAVQPGKTYMVRVINMAAFSQAYVRIDQHNMTIIEADGIYTQPRDIRDLYIATGQRYSVLLHTHATAARNFGIMAMLDTSKFDHTTDYLISNVTGYLVYDAAKPLRAPPAVDAWHIIDDLTLVPRDVQPIYTPVNRQIHYDLNFFTAYGMNRAGLNNISYVAPKVPTLFTALSAPASEVHNPLIYGPLTNTMVIKYNDVVEIVITNYDTGAHPMHLHGHAPQIISRVPSLSDTLQGATIGNTSVFLDGPTTINAAIPMRRDVWQLAPGGSVTIRYRADNPGVWLLHCHMEWHVEAGLSATLVEAPMHLRRNQPKIAQGWKDNCKAQGIPIVGNAGGNTKDWTEVSNAPTGPREGRTPGAVYP